MCGIVYCRTKIGNANKDIKTLYFDQKDRGKKGYGFFNVEKGIHARTKYEHEILHELKMNKGNDILFHHRKPTSTENEVNAAHPLCSGNNFKDHKYFMVHNGSIYNSQALYTKHTDAKLVYESITGVSKFDYMIFNDSESLMLELALVIEGIKDKKDFNAYGSMAFIMVQTDNNGKRLNLFYGRNQGSPLKIKNTKDKFILASELNDGVDVKPDRLYKFNYATMVLSSEEMKFERSYSVSDNTKIIDKHLGRRTIFSGRTHQHDYTCRSGCKWGFSHLEMETPTDRQSIIENNLNRVNTYFLNDDDDSPLVIKTNDELTDLEQQFTCDVETCKDVMSSEHDPERLAELRIDLKELERALKNIENEIGRRVKEDFENEISRLPKV